MSSREQSGVNPLKAMPSACRIRECTLFIGHEHDALNGSCRGEEEEAALVTLYEVALLSFLTLVPT